MIHIISDYYFETDDHQYILYQCGVREKQSFGKKEPTGEMKEFQNVLGYYGNISGMLNGCMRHANRTACKRGDIKNLKECIDHLDDIAGKILETTKGY